MTKLKFVFLVLVCIGYSLTSFAHETKPISCKDFQNFREIKNKINSIDKTFQWDSSDCKIVGTKSIFPRTNKNGDVKFESGLQIFVYNNDQLKFICLPDWVCNPWQS